MKVNNIFIPGDEWIYIQLYCGELSIDEILRNQFFSLLKKFKKANIIDKWFFIRYSAPSSHLRLRIKLISPNNLLDVINPLNNIIKKLIKQNKVWEVNFGTYKRELSRYSYTSYEITEDLFYLDSYTYLESMAFLKSEEQNIYYSMRNALDFIMIFYKNPNDTISFIKDMETNYKLEFNIDKEREKKLGLKYRNLKKDIYEIFNDKSSDNKEIKRILIRKENKVKQLLLNQKYKNLSKFKFVSGHVHMNINRTFSHNQRLYEMMIYDFLFRYYNSMLKSKKYD